MDKYELSIKEEKIKKHVEKKDYAAAAKIADTIDWSKIKNIKMLRIISKVYEELENYTEAKNVLLLAYERVPMGYRMLYRLTELSLKEGKLEEAESYFEEYRKAAGDDMNGLLLSYQLESAKGSSLSRLIAILEAYRRKEDERKLPPEEKWFYELAKLYEKAGRIDDCVRACSQMIEMFSLGIYIDKALNLKMQYAPLTPLEQEKLVDKKKYEDRYFAVKQDFERREYQGIREEDHEEIELRRKTEQLREAAMTNEPEEVPVSDKVISISAALHPAPAESESEIEETSAAAKRMFFAGESLAETEPAGALEDEIFDMQASLAQSVKEAAKEPEPSEEPETDGGSDSLGQTKEVVKETRKILEQERQSPAASEEEAAVSEEMSGAYGEEPAMPEEETAMPEAEGAVPEAEAAVSEEMPEAYGEEPAMPEEEAAVPEEESLVSEETSGGFEEEPDGAEGTFPLSEEEPAESEEEPAESEEEPVESAETTEALEEAPASDGAEITCVVVEAEAGEGRIPFAVEKLKKTHEVLGSETTQAAKISGARLSAKGVHNTFKRLAGRDLIVDGAAELSHEAAAELVEEIKHPRMPLVLILLDSAERLDEFLMANPKLDELCVYLEEGGRMDIDEFVACANDYAKEEECVIEEMAGLAIYAIAERLRNDGTELTEEAAKKLVDEAIDRAEHRGIKGLFGSKYDKEGYLILKEQFFKNL